MSSGHSQQLLRGTKKGNFEGRKTQLYQASAGLRASSQE
jgi:thymidine kinase